jgi:hypothetical protein
MALVGQTDEKEASIELAVEARASKAQLFWTSPWLHFSALVLFVAATFGRTLSNYFLADDFCEIAYVSRIFEGDSGLFWSNFTGNYMQIPGMNVYRPWLMCSLVNDWLFFHAQAWGYYLTNLIYFIAVVLLLYVVVRQLTEDWGKVRSSATALMSALLFAASPLHCESVSWAVGRVDIIAACFYLLGFSCFLYSLRKRSKRFEIFGVSAFIFALGTKEMAVGLPVLVAAVAFLWGNGNWFWPRRSISGSTGGPSPSPSLSLNLWQRFKHAVVSSLPLWITLGCYFVIRMLCLKTLVGGYVGGFGASQLSEMVHHWLDPDTIRRLCIPLNNELYGANPMYGTLVGMTELVIATVALVRILAGYASWRWLIFLAVWCATAAAPIFQLWGLGYNLEGARFYFFLSLPISLIIPVLLFHPSSSDLSSESEPGQSGVKKPQSWINIEKALYLTGSMATLALLVLLQKATMQTNMLWVHAGKEVKRLSDACQVLVNTHPGQTKFLILGIPKDNAGAHMILNGTTFDIVLRPPFTKSDYAERLLNCDAVMYSPEQYVNGSQLRWMLDRKDVSGPYVWSREKQALLKFDYHTQRLANGEMPLPVINLSGSGPVFDLGKIDPLDYQFLQFDLKVDSEGPVSGLVSWTGANKASSPQSSRSAAEESRFATEDSKSAAGDSKFVAEGSRSASAPFGLAGGTRAGEFQIVTINLGHYWRWYTQGGIRRIHITLPPGMACDVRNVRLLPPALCAPALSTEMTNSAQENPYAASVSTSPVRLLLAPAAVPGAKSVALEIGRQDYFFDNFQDDGKVSAVAKTNVYPADTTSIPLDTNVGSAIFPGPGFYQIRAQYLNAKGQKIGASSDPVTLKLSR